MGPLLCGATYPFSYPILQEICKFPGNYLAVWSGTSPKNFIHVYYQHNQSYHLRQSANLIYLCRKASAGDIGSSRNQSPNQYFLKIKKGGQSIRIYYSCCKPHTIIQKIKQVYQNISQPAIIGIDVLDAILASNQQQEKYADED